MNIAGIIPRLTFQGGAEKYIVRLYEILMKKHDINIYTMSFDKNVFPTIEEIVVELGDPWILKRMSGRKESLLLKSLGMKTLLNKLPKDYEIYNSHIFPTNLIARKPNVYTCQEPPRMIYDLMEISLSRRSKWQQIIPRLYYPILRAWDKFETNKNVDAIIVNSENSKEYISKIYKEPLNVIYPGVDDNYFKIQNEPENTVLCVGRLWQAKRIDLAIEAFAKSDNSDLKLEIIGTGPEEQNLKSLVNKLGLKNVLFRGQVSEAELMNSYSKALVVLYTPIREMFGIVPIEAMAAGVPVIATNEGGPKETIIDGKTGYLIDSNKDHIAEKINQLKSKDIWIEMSKQAKNRAKMFTWNEVANQTINIFNSLL